MGRTRKKKHSMKKKLGLILVLILVIIASYFILRHFFGESSTPSVEDGTCQFHFVDVGQGDCSMFLTEDACVVIDAGPRGVSFETAAYIAYRTDKIDYLILTHPDEDHLGGAATLLSALKVENVIMSDAVKDTYSFTRFLDTVELLKINVIKAVAGKQYSAGDMTLTVLAPLGNFDEDYNDYSVVTKIEFGDTSAIVTGDAEQGSEHLMIKKYGEKLKTDVLKLAHHGSSTSTGIEFFEVTSPDIAIISCGKDNAYGHPHRETIELLNDFGVDYYRTDKEGSIVLISDGKTVRHK